MIKLLLFFSFAFAGSPPTLDTAEFSSLAIQDGGRLKPFDTFARESVQLITGSRNYQGKNPNELVLSWLFLPTEWSKQKFFQIKHIELKKDLGVADADNYMSPAEIMGNQKLMDLFKEVGLLLKDKKKLNPYFNGVNKLRNQVNVYNDIISGSGIKLVPQRLSPDWLSIVELRDEGKTKFTAVAESYFLTISGKDPGSFQRATAEFKSFAQNQNPQGYGKDLDLEIKYNKLRPFQQAYVFYFAAALFFLLSFNFPKKILLNLAFLFSGIGWLIHVTGFAMRCWIAGRPPVSNMYESIIWVSLGCMTFGMIFEMIYKKRYIGFAATFMAALALIVGDAAPAVIDQSIQPLEAVLKSNYWLTIHVLTITLSYAAFTLATGIGNVALFIYARGQAPQNREKLQALSLYVYRAVQVGVLLLTAGTILGGVWADASWGRFWGWDPKETWALIADLFYLAVLHGRFTGWLRNFGTVAASICCFTAVIMAWYGVNFVLGIGKHSYGFGAGGVHYVGAAVLAQLLFVAYAYSRFRTSSPSLPPHA